MNSGQSDLMRCAKCGSTMLASFFDFNRKGCRYRTCNNCRGKAGSLQNPRVKCLCGEELLWSSLDRHTSTKRHKEWRKNNMFKCECGHWVLTKDKDEHLNSFSHHLRVALETDEVQRFNNLTEWAEPPEGGETTPHKGSY
jgi:hypothetical protein